VFTNKDSNRHWGSNYNDGELFALMGCSDSGHTAESIAIL
jgi:hypothetical protein